MQKNDTEQGKGSTSDKEGQRTGHKRDVAEVFELFKSYVRQELLDPLEVVPRWLALGLIGSIAIATGVLLFVLALIRYLQTDTGEVFIGSFSWAPYAIAIVALVMVILMVRRLINKRSLS